MDEHERAWQLLPGRLEAKRPADFRSAEELRLRLGQPPSYLAGGKEHPLSADKVIQADICRVLEKATSASMYASKEALSNGFLSYQGLRIGICGTALYCEGTLSGFRSYSSLCIRIPKECRGICDELVTQLADTGFQNTVFLSPPGGGKTTALRELIRCLSDSGIRIGIIDCRNEIAAMQSAGNGFDVGAHSDVITGVTKYEGAMMLLQGMAPQIIAMDEISRREDATILDEIVGCGVSILATAHSSGPEEFLSRPLYREIAEKKIFRNIICITGTGGKRRYILKRM